MNVGKMKGKMKTAGKNGKALCAVALNVILALSLHAADKWNNERRERWAWHSPSDTCAA